MTFYNNYSQKCTKCTKTGCGVLISEFFRTEKRCGDKMEGINKCKVNYYRTYLGISQRELARRADTAASTISEIEKGERLPNVLLAIRIAHILEVTVEDLWENEGRIE